MKSILLAALIFAHSWYDAYCCSDKDCGPVASAEVHREPGGYRVRGYFISENSGNVKPSQDNRYHACFHGEALLCLYIPQGAV